ncbi:hypothetical protein [Kitasatospora cinereorecta]|uniref:Uncharacterized protein n=1 Tax=Kitasatospora cinereorecta TaxID=285560 RepID=A0ABW0VFD1_9ACTN
MTNQQQGDGQDDIHDIRERSEIPERLPTRTCGWCGEEMTYPPRRCEDSWELCAACTACLCDDEGDEVCRKYRDQSHRG